MTIVLIITFMIAYLVKIAMRWFYRKISRKRKIKAGGFYLISVMVRLIIIILGISYAISLEPMVRSLSTSLLASAGLATAIIGFAAKDVLSNFVSGAVIILFRPFTVTEWINVENVHEGVVEEISLVFTVIRDRTHRRMIIPNSKILSNYVVNSSYKDERLCQYVEFGISYGSDVKLAKKIIREIAEVHPLCIDNRTKKQKREDFPIVEVRLIEFGDFAIKLRALVWVKDALDARHVKWALNEPVKDQFDQAGIEIPLPYRNLIFKNEPTANFKRDNAE